MRRNDMIQTLQMDIEIPEVVQERANEAFDKIRLTDRKTENMKSYSLKSKEAGNMFRFPNKRIAVMIAAATLAFASITATAAYIHWSKSLSEGLQITEKQKIQLEENHAVAYVGQTCTDQGITVSAVQSITDNYFTHIVFRVEGYEVADGAQPDFETMHVTVDGRDDFNWGASFYNSLIIGADGKVTYADGTPINLDTEESFERYVLEDGSMEYWITLSSSTKGYFINKPIHVELRNLGTVHKAEYFDDIEGSWDFDWNLQGSEEMKECILHETLGDTNATVCKAELSPISLHVEYEFPRQQMTEAGVDENGETIYHNTFVEPPMIMGVKMKDGTWYPYITDGGSMGYESEESELYTATFATSQVLDVNQIESLLFLKSYPENLELLTEENFYVVPLP